MKISLLIWFASWENTWMLATSFTCYQITSEIWVTNKATKLLSALTVFWHCFHNDVMAYMPEISECTMNRIFVAWVVFMELIFSGLKSWTWSWIFTLHYTRCFIKTFHGLAGIIDFTEFKLHWPSNYDLRALTFLNYKNVDTDFFQIEWD